MAVTRSTEDEWRGLTSTVHELLRKSASALLAERWDDALMYARAAAQLDKGNVSAQRFERAAQRRLEAIAPAPSNLDSLPARPSRGAGQSVEEAALHVDRLNPLPASAQRVLQLTQDKPASVDALDLVIGSDPALSANVLRIARSPSFTQSRRVATVRQAIVQLSTEEIRSVALSTDYRNAASVSSALSYADFWLFSLMTGVLTELQSIVYGVGRQQAFNAGVLHNIGLLALDLIDPDGLRAVLAKGDGGLLRLHDREREVFGFSDAELGGALAVRWRFPAQIAQAISQHGERVTPLVELPPLSAYVIRSRILLRSQGLHDGAEQSEPREVPPEWADGRLARALEQLGGIRSIRERADATGRLEALVTHPWAS